MSAASGTILLTYADLEVGAAGRDVLTDGTYIETVDFVTAHERYAKVQAGAKFTWDQCRMDGATLDCRHVQRQAFEERWRRVGAR